MQYVEEVKRIELSQGKVALVSARDFKRLSRWKWHASKRRHGLWYARRSFPGGCVYLHREVLRVADPKILVDHIDRNGLNNVRSNLRLVDRFQNGHNRVGWQTRKTTSHRKGVHYNKHTGLWIAQIMVRGERINRSAQTEKEAIAIRDELEELYGEYGRSS